MIDSYEHHQYEKQLAATYFRPSKPRIPHPIDISAAEGRFSWDDLVYFKELKPNRHFRYHLLTALLSIACGSVILAEHAFDALTFQVCCQTTTTTTLIIG